MSRWGFPSCMYPPVPGLSAMAPGIMVDDLDTQESIGPFPWLTDNLSFLEHAFLYLDVTGVVLERR